MNIVGLDLSLRATGLARANGTLWTIKPGKRSGAERLAFIQQQLQQPIKQADLVVIENYAFGARGRSLYNIGELGGVVRLTCYLARTPYIEVAPAKLKQFATGKGNASKDEMMQAALKAGATPEDHNAADAWWLQQYGKTLGVVA